MKGLFIILLAILPAQMLCSQIVNLKWAKQMGGTNSSSVSNAVAVDKQGNVYTTGSFSGTVDFDPGPAVFNLTSLGFQNSFVSKLDSAGNFLWAKQLGKKGNSAGSAIVVDSLGNAYTTGYFDATVDFDPGAGSYELTSFGGDGDIYVSVLDANGGFMWAKQMGGIYNDQGSAITLDKARNVYITGDAEGDVDFDPGTGVYTLTAWGHYVCKLNLYGNFIWAKVVPATGFSTGRSIVVDANENVYTTGWFGGSVDFNPGPADFIMDAGGISNYILKLDKRGDFVWAKQMGGSFNWDAAAMAIDPSGKLIVTGTFESTEDFDPGPGVFQMTPVGGLDIFICKFDENANFVWAKQIGGAGWEVVNSIVTDANGNSYFTGWFDGTVDFDPGAGTKQISSIDVRDIYVASLDADGNFIWATQLGGPGPRPVTASFPLSGNGIALDPYGSVYTTGSFNLTVDFDPNATTFNLTSAGSQDIFVQKMRRCVQSAPTKLVATACGSYSLNGKIYDSTGTYQQSFINASGCDSIVTLELTINARPITEINKSICQGQSFAGHSVSGIYLDTIQLQSGCDSITKLNLSVDSPPSPDLGPDRGICLGDSLVLTPGEFTSYSWLNGANSKNLIVKQPGVYSVTVQNGCGTGRDEIVVKAIACDILFPNAFTPNNDGLNDLFRMSGKADFSEFELVVYDRWGRRVFITHDYTQGWDGTVGGKKQTAGAYAWYCSYKKGNSIATTKGTVVLIR